MGEPAPTGGNMIRVGILAAGLFAVLQAASMLPRTIIPGDNPPAVLSGQTARFQPRAGAVANRSAVAVDTVGATTYDWQSSGPMYRFLVNSPDYGIHVTWMYSAELGGTAFSDRNMRYNFYDYAMSAWNWIDSDKVQSGVSVFGERSGYGSLAVDPSTGAAVIGRHSGAPARPGVARDIAPGAGIFEHADASPIGVDCQWPPIAVGPGGAIRQLGMLASTYELDYMQVSTWPNYGAAIRGFDPSPGFPTHNIAASRVSQKVCCTWNSSTEPATVSYYRVSADGGMTWGDVVALAAPAAFGGDTVSSFHVTGSFPYYDRQDSLHLVTTIMPVVNDTGYVTPVGIWHWSGGTWSRIHRAGCDPSNLEASVGYNALYACRPSLGENAQGELFVAWEQFDSANVEPMTNLLRADVFVSASYDGGATWIPGIKVTSAGTTSCRFPCIMDWGCSGSDIVASYEVDEVAGFGAVGEGPVTVNPIVVGHVRSDGLLGVDRQGAARLTLVAPTMVASTTVLGYSIPFGGSVSLDVFDAAGRNVSMLVDCYQAAGNYSARWNVSDLPRGCYVARLTSGQGSISRKLVLTR